MTSIPFTPDINYLHGQLLGQRALILGLAGLLVEQPQFRQEGLVRLQAVRDSVVAQPVQETTLAGIDSIAAWLRNVTG